MAKSFPTPEKFIQKMEKLGLTEQVQAYKIVIDLVKAIKEKEGRGLLVGGSVRDALMGKISKDFDIEVYGLEAKVVEEVVGRFGKVSDVGKSFGILKISLKGGVDIDASLPRTDSKISKGHRGFEVKTDPKMSIKDAARRRDFTINSIAADPLTGELFDSFGGVGDLRKKILKITDQERFKDDPLRVLRAMQFIGRFGLKPDRASIPVLKSMIPKLKELPKERIGDEWKKLLLKSVKPSLGLSFGMTLGVFKKIHPELYSLTKTPQEREYHPEGNVWTHTLMATDRAAKIVRRENLKNNQALVIILAVLCHDLGKLATTEFKEGRIISYKHQEKAEEPTKKFLASIDADTDTKKKVVKLVTNHLIPTLLYTEEVIKKNKISDGAIRRLAKRIYPATIKELLLVAEAVYLGRGLKKGTKYSAKAWLLKRALKLKVELTKPKDLIRGKDWLALGFNPGPPIGELINLANDLRDEKQFTKQMVLKKVKGIDDPGKAIKKLKSLLKN